MSAIRLLSGLLCLPLFAAVVTVRTLERTDLDSGKTFGAAGPYERIRAKAYFAVDPKDPANANIVDLGLAPVNEKGFVEFSADVVIDKPRNSRQGNGTVLVDITNRGNMTLNGFNGADSFLYAQGYTNVHIGWQFDVPEREGLLRLTVPEAPVRGLVRGQFVPPARTTSFLVSDRNHVPFPVAGEDGARLLVRDTPESAPREIRRADWRFSDPTHVEYSKGFEPGKIYEVIYTAEGSPIAGLGPAAVRDLVSYLKYGGGNATSSVSDYRFKRAIAAGRSQSGRFLRTFLYDGFNADEKNRKVLDGVFALVAGAGRGSFNLRFAQPSRDGHPLLNLFYPTDLFPFTDLPTTDEDMGLTAGLLDKVKPEHRPKIFYYNGSYEYWGRAASLIHTTPDGKQDVPVPPDTRIYYVAGTQHGSGAKPVRNHTQQLSNPMDYNWAMRALLAALNDWIKDGTEPPPSRYPRVDKDELVAFGALQFPKIPGVSLPKSITATNRLDFATEPPKIGKPYGVRLPQVNRDGNETSGIRMPELAVPLATYTGWNLRDQSIGAPDRIFDMIGSYIPFAKSEAERKKNGDPRASIAERYRSKDDYLKQIDSAAADLVRQRYVLEADVPKIREAAAARWDSLMN